MTYVRRALIAAVTLLVSLTVHAQDSNPEADGCQTIATSCNSSVTGDIMLLQLPTGKRLVRRMEIRG